MLAHIYHSIYCITGKGYSEHFSSALSTA